MIVLVTRGSDPYERNEILGAGELQDIMEVMND